MGTLGGTWTDEEKYIGGLHIHGGVAARFNNNLNGFQTETLFEDDNVSPVLY